MKALFVLEDLIEKIIKFVQISRIIYKKMYAKVADYNPEAIIGMFTGLMLVFFGGFFVVTLAMIEAFKQGGIDSFFENLKLLEEQIKAVEVANAEDDKKDEDGNGIPDVQEISKDELAARKLRVALRAMDPAVVQTALGNLWTAVVSASATVKLHFARTIALGVSIGNYLFRPLERYIIPLIESFTDKEYHKWYRPLFSYICRLIGASIAFQIQRVLSVSLN